MFAIIYLKSILEKIDSRRDRFLFPLIKNYWPRCITPNYLTVLRIIIGIALCFLLFFGFENKTYIIPFFSLAILLDLFDGSVARALNKKTEMGAFLDPLADRILIIPIAAYSLFKNYKQLLLLLILPEIIFIFTTVYYKIQNQIIKINIFGKTKMLLESAAFGIILINLPFSPPKISLILLFLAVGSAFLALFFQWSNLLSLSKNKK